MIKEYLKKVRKLYLEIEAKKRQREQLYHMITGSGIPIRDVDVQTSISGDKLGDTMSEIADLDASIKKKIRTLCKAQNDVAKMFRGLSKPEYRAIMTDYYINAYTWERVAELNGYSIQHVWRLHGKALNELEENESK